MAILIGKFFFSFIKSKFAPSYHWIFVKKYEYFKAMYSERLYKVYSLTIRINQLVSQSGGNQLR